MSDEELKFDWYFRKGDIWERDEENVVPNEESWNIICAKAVKKIFLNDFSIVLICLRDTGRTSKFAIQYAVQNEIETQCEDNAMPLAVCSNKRTKGDNIEQGGCFLIFDSCSYDKTILNKRILDMLNFVLKSKEYDDDYFNLLTEFYMAAPNANQAKIKYQEFLNKQISGLIDELQKFKKSSKTVSDIKIHCWMVLLDCEDEFAESIENGDFIIPEQVKAIGVPRYIPRFSSTRSSNQEKVVENSLEHKADKNSDIVKESGASINKEQNHFSEETYNVKYMNKGDR